MKRRRSTRASTTDDVLSRMTAMPQAIADARRAALQIFMNRNDSLTDDALKYVNGIEREAWAQALDYASELFGKTTSVHLMTMARRLREAPASPARTKRKGE